MSAVEDKKEKEKEGLVKVVPNEYLTFKYKINPVTCTKLN